MEAVPRLSMICCDLKVSPSNTEFGPVLKRYIKYHYHEDSEAYSKEIKELEALRQNAIKAPMDFTGCSILKKYYAQLQKLQSRFPMTDDGAACVPFMWTDIYSGVAYNITDIEYEEACILYNIGALHSKLGTMDSRVNPEGIKIACTHFQCAAFAFQHLRDTYPQPKGSDMSHDLLTCFINIMLAQAQECILEKSMLDNRKSSITAKIATQVVEYYKCALGVMVSGSPSSDAGSILDIVGSKIHKGWKKFIQFKMCYYTAIAHLYMGNQAEENEKWGERVAWYQSSFDQLTEAFKIAKKLDREELNEALSFTNDVIAGKHSSSKKENDFVYHDKVPALSSLPELKGASLVKGIPFSASDPEVSGPDIFARLVPMEAHETSSLYSEEKAKILRSVSSKVEGKNEELVAYLSSLQLETTSFDEEERIPQELIEKCAALSVRPTAINDLKSLMNELLEVSNDVELSLKTSRTLLAEEDQKETKHQDTFGKRGPSMITVDLKKECSKYEEAHKKAIASNNTLQAAVNLHIENLTKLSAPLEQIAESLPSASSLKTPENVKAMDDFNHLVNKVEEMRRQRQFLENQLREALMKDDITKRLVTLDKKDDLQQTFSQELKKHDETLIYLDQNLTAQDNILCALTAANAQYADTRQALREIKQKREEIVKMLISSYDSYDDLMEKAKKGLEFYKKLQSNATRLLTRIKSVTKVQDEERAQRAEAELRKGGRMNPHSVPQEQQTPKLRDYLPYMNKRGIPAGVPGAPPAPYMYPSLQPSSAPTQVPFGPEPMRQATLGGPASGPTSFDRSLKPLPTDIARPGDGSVSSSMGIRPAPVGSEQTSASAAGPAALPSSGAGYPSAAWSSTITSVNGTLQNSQVPMQYPTANQTPQTVKNAVHAAQMPYASNSGLPSVSAPQGYHSSAPVHSYGAQNYSYHSHQPASLPNAAAPYSYGVAQQPGYQAPTNVSGNHQPPVTSGTVAYMHNASGYSVGPPDAVNSATPANSVGSTGYASSHPVSSQVPSNLPGSCYPPTSVTASVTYPAASFPVGTGERNVYSGTSITSTNNSNVLSTNPPSMPYSSGQVIPPIVSSSVGNYGIPPQNYSAYSTNQMYSAPSGYALPTSAYNGTSVPNSLQQHIQVPGALVQSKQASVTASMDTKTNTLNSLDPYVVANSKVDNMYSQQNMYAYMTNNSSVNTSVASNSSSALMKVPTVGLGMQTQTNVPTNAGSPQAVFPNSAVQGQTVSYVGQVGYPYSTVQGQPTNISTGQTGYSSNTVPNQTSFPSSSAQVPASFPHNSMQSQAMIPSRMHDQVSGTFPSQPVTPNSFQVQGNNPVARTVQSQAGPYYTSQANYGAYSASAVSASIYNPPAQNSFAAAPSSYPQNSYTSNQVISYAVNDGMSVSGPHQNYVAPSSTNVQHGNYIQSQQQIDQTSSAVTDSINAAYGSTSNIPNQQLQPPMEPKPLTPSSSMQSSPMHVSTEPNGTTVSPDPIPRPSSVDSQSDVKRDFITPPPDTTVAPDKEEASTLPVLQPKVIDIQAIAAMKEKESSHLAKDPLDDPAVCAKFVSEVEKYEKFVDGLLRKSLNGTTPLDQKWKEFTDVQDKESRKRSISVARCCPLKNRFPDVMPYDSNRVKLTSAKDDYINASYLKDICPNSPVFVITQAPMPATFNDFWLMVWEQQVETLICLLSDTELKTHVYFPKDRGQILNFGAHEVSLQSYKAKNGFVERMITLTHVKTRNSRVVVHLQYTEWPVSNVPSSPATLLQFITDALSYYKQQRNLLRPVVVHCSAGIGRSGCFCLITAMVSDMNDGHGPRDVTQVAAFVSHQRKFLLQDKDQLMFCYNSVLYYAQDILMRRGILTTRASFDDKLPSCNTTSSHVRHPSEDFILGGGLAKLQSGIAKLGLTSDSSETPAPAPEPETETPNPVSNGDTIAPESEPKETTNVEMKEDGDMKITKETSDKIPSITSLLDPSNFTLDSTNSPAKRKITKENFASSKGSLSTSSSDNSDPLSQLDPLWSLKK